MMVLFELFEWGVTLTGIVVLVMIVVRTTQKEDSPLVKLLGTVKALCIKIGGACALLMLLMINYRVTGGALTVKSIGFYVAVGSILFSLAQGWGSSAFFGDVGTVMAHKAKEMQDRINKMAEDAKHADAEKKTPPPPPQTPSPQNG